MSLFADGFSLSPLVLNRVEVGRIRREVSKGVARLAEGVLNVSAFVERGVVQNDHGSGGTLRQEDVANPGVKDIGTNGGLEQTDRHKPQANKRTDHIDSPSGIPVTETVTA
ncbi:MAG TPA: hypothetical protein P5149_13575 [Candidatus Competibacteraceae bacterium]|nr:hypothetical protein [Candidatus Competibacteraceae bacterium]HRY19416.1 hypothetical protein [Candidatus Competibacteraceae bacterium]